MYVFLWRTVSKFLMRFPPSQTETIDLCCQNLLTLIVAERAINNITCWSTRWRPYNCTLFRSSLFSQPNHSKADFLPSSFYNSPHWDPEICSTSQPHPTFLLSNDFSQHPPQRTQPTILSLSPNNHVELRPPRRVTKRTDPPYIQKANISPHPIPSHPSGALGSQSRPSKINSNSFLAHNDFSHQTLP